ncbi:MAG TPA: hypothetical protein VFK94_00030 [Patescibacteria group bacterium]|nr:hypothetical protein [Patescibacteria group bacterium]
MNWTSTRVPLWQTDCQNFWRAGSPFEVRDVTDLKDTEFLENFASSHNLFYTRWGTTIRFAAPQLS